MFAKVRNFYLQKTGITSVFLIKLDDDVPNPTQSRSPIDWSVDK